MVNLLKGMFAIIFDELKFSIKRKTITSYILFSFVFAISLYGTYMQEYGAVQGEMPLLSILPIELEKGVAPLTDFAIFLMTLFGSALQSASVGAEVSPDVVLPVDIGITLFIIAPVLIALSSLSKMAVRLCASSIARERESKTLYQLLVSPQPRVTAYLSKFIGAIGATIPMIFLVLAGVVWIIGASFMPYIEVEQAVQLRNQVLVASIVTTFLFASIGIFISTITRNEESAVNRGGWILKIMLALATLWIFLPIFSVAGESAASMIEKITMISPLTLDMVALYSGEMFNQYMLIQLVVGLLFLFGGIMIFVRQDVEY
ncbi:MAG: ABC transporter permease subunit [Methanosarcinaceae archaeon]|nr:ABC transporter permease [Methanosarcinaceae archaeon]MDF1534094.1 ABC transporter permease subunit [Methanosarcinaceae archaeon]